MSGLGWVMVLLVAMLGSGLLFVAGVAVVIAVLWDVSSRIVARDADQ